MLHSKFSDPRGKLRGGVAAHIYDLALNGLLLRPLCISLKACEGACALAISMMACSYLSASGVKPQSSTTGCWTPPYCMPEPESSRMLPFTRPPLPPLVVPQLPPSPLPSLPLSAAISEPALDLTTSMKSRVPSSEDDSE
ncbi:hypothetical protein KGM_214276 [Danaus plexippus plexippus]|uniref:Uncharacterized protein n=1 Tax=Danaus plexippus plexippus TaxID=278856 RepID=A0A212FDR2_DANPL|nr:hypothetical protein KGM_214276 [Danaus plexippus plexippus]